MAEGLTPPAGVLARRDRALVWSMAALYAAVFSALSILKYRYYLYDDFDLAIFAQALSAMVSLGALPVFWLARRELPDSRAALVFPALYLLHPALGAANLYEFHPEVLCLQLLLFTFVFLREGRLGPTALFAALALLAREDVE